MASEVSICNLALGYLGDRATVTSLNPPEGSAQAEHCAQFYPIARDAMLERHDWGFATRRALGALLAGNSTDWAYAYAVPANMVRVQAVLPQLGVTTGVSGLDCTGQIYQNRPQRRVGEDRPQDFRVETLDGVRAIYTNQQDAVIRYTYRVTDPAQFSPLFTLALAHWLASMLAGPVLKGRAGSAAAEQQLRMAAVYIAQAGVSDANQQQVAAETPAPWIAAR